MAAGAFGNLALRIVVLFNSAPFLFGFLPLCLAGFFVAARRHLPIAMLWLALCSLFFYGWWDPQALPLLLGSISINFAMGRRLAQAGSAGTSNRPLLTAGVLLNLGALAYFKYANFFLENLSAALGSTSSPLHVALPIGISFFTFTQIAFLVDAHAGKAREFDFPRYVLFVSYFPHLVAGPILHHGEMMPQFAPRMASNIRASNLAVGITIFAIGLFKKIVLADSLAPHAKVVFDAAAAGHALTLLEAWSGVLSYTLQLYFDFSGYSDMAIGISQLFGIRLPVNFDSPYKAANITDFWRRWHMTLSRFLRDYVYVPLGGNRKGAARRYMNLFITMVLGGLWHGAGWTYIIWGALHGTYLAVHHWYRKNRTELHPHWGNHAAAVLATFLAVVVGWVFFRADSVPAAMRLIGAMIGNHGIALPETLSIEPLAGFVKAWGIEFRPTTTLISPRHLAALTALLVCVWCLPNTQQLMRDHEIALPVYANALAVKTGLHLKWSASLAWLILTCITTWVALASMLSGRESPFLYFNF